MNDKIAEYQFKRDFLIQTVVQEIQFEQWVKTTFYLNHKLTEEFDNIYQNSFYVKLYELLTEGLEFAKKLYSHIKDSSNENKKEWYLYFIESFSNIKSELKEEEFNYIEYRRHSACHIFQDKYEHIQKESFKIKKTRKNKSLLDFNNEIKSLVVKYGSDEGVDIHLNKMLSPKLKEIYDVLTK